ncbi:hypothetical protein EPUS_02495 [Endocarpon pusillum Z07020]|uniref:Mitochondrial import inner membrane translocase subunit TIM44 n=1 Tax=Endocarpon pusillum (strain Z07020 / HMAS-L-300199) TaxID=1263415 RepID=U1HNQ3_ENDPU|nr:uncharacterized protein EPUS_02495 [Endocarpon pusillum Z07020]ERF70629.1 hypothetical protein EPUS_02495 [Endocarpon pusillum Z07020]
MITPCRVAASRHLQHAPALVSLASSRSRTLASRRLSTQRAFFSQDHPFLTPTHSNQQLLLAQSALRPSTSPLLLRSHISLARLLHTSSPQFEQTRPTDEVRDSPRVESSTGTGTDPSRNEESKTDDAKDEKSGEESSDAKNESKKDEPPPPPHGDKSPWQVFTETLRSEFKASKEWNESTKQLASSAHQFTESESVKRARAAYDATAGAATSKTAEALKTTGKALGQGAAWTWDTKMVQGIRGGVNATGRGIEKVTRPVRETKTFQSIKEAVDDGSSSTYGGWVEKEERRKKKELRDMKEVQSGRGPPEKWEEDPDAGTNVTLHKDSAWKESWNSFRDSSKIMQSVFALRSTYNESENPLISTARSISDRVAGFFAENETAMVIKKFREMDPSFQIEPFLRDMREYILPEVLDAYVKGDVETLKLWLSAAQFQVYSALMQQYTTAGLKSDGRILDIRNVDILNARMLEPGDIPVFIITCRTQEVHVYRNAKSGELAAGMEDRVQLVTYAIGVTRTPEDVNNPETRGWRMIELQKAGRDYI